jgi:predicted amidophosphoribosyltransferase
MMVLCGAFAAGLALWVVAPVIWPGRAPIAAGEAVCPNCGPRLESDARFCSNCGAETSS